ncbi:hypothetical protein ACHAWF_006257 [Thalassiosira exigua]
MVREGGGGAGSGRCAGQVLPADPFSYQSTTTPTRPPKKEERYVDFKLNGHWKSSCTWRVHTALAAKGVPHAIVPVNILARYRTSFKGSKAHAARNPMRQVPTLEFVDRELGGATALISRSLAIVEFLEAAYAERGGRLLLEDPVLTEKVKEVAEIINAGVQPLQNLSVAEAIDRASSREGAGQEFGRDAIARGLSSLEAILALHDPDEATGARHGGSYAVGSHGPGLADFCLVPQLCDTRRFGVDCAPYLTLRKVEGACKAHPWFRDVPEFQKDYGCLS